MNKRSLILLVILLTGIVFNLNVLAKEYEISDYDIELTLTREGDYLITEKITYNFLEGSFTSAYREISGKGFSGLEFISLEAAGTELLDYDLDRGGDLEVSWTFPPASGEKTFILNYRASGGLITRDNENIIDWNPVGSGWSVPIEDIDIRLYLPWNVDGIKVQPEEDLVYRGNREVHLHYDRLPPSTYYHIVVSFPQQLETGRGEGLNFIPFLIAMVLGVILVILDLTAGRPRVEPVKPAEGISDISFGETALIYSSGLQNRKGVSASVFNLAKRGKIKLCSQVRKGVFGSKKVEVEPEIISEEGLTAEERLIIEGLKENKTLKKFALDYKLFNKVHRKVDESLKEKGLISRQFLQRRNKTFLSALVFALPALAALIYGLAGQYAAVAGSGVALLIIAAGRLIKGFAIPILSPEGLYLKEETADFLEHRKKEIDELVKADKANEALKCFFQELEYIILHKNFNSYDLNKYKKVFKKAEEIEIPSWLELSVDDLDTTLDKLELVEVIDYVVMSTVVVAASTGTTSAGVGAPGSGAGGGGGGAG